MMKSIQNFPRKSECNYKRNEFSDEIHAEGALSVNRAPAYGIGVPIYI